MTAVPVGVAPAGVVPGGGVPGGTVVPALAFVPAGSTSGGPGGAATPAPGPAGGAPDDFARRRIGRRAWSGSRRRW